MSSFKDDANAVLKRITAAINSAMPAVGADIQNCIAEHVQVDVYAKRRARVYPPSGNLLQGAIDADITVGGGHVIVDYEPEPSNDTTWGQMPPEKMKAYHKKPSDPVKEDAAENPDAFIARIETGNYPFDTDVGARPFLSAAVSELIEGKRALRTFISALNMADADLKAFDAGDTEIVRTGDDFTGY